MSDKKIKEFGREVMALAEQMDLGVPEVVATLEIVKATYLDTILTVAKEEMAKEGK